MRLKWILCFFKLHFFEKYICLLRRYVNSRNFHDRVISIH